MIIINADTARYCYLDLDLQHTRARLARAAAFVHATDTRYGWSSKHLLLLGGSDLARLPELFATDHDWGSSTNNDNGQCDNNNNILVRPPDHGSRIVVQLHWEDAPLACENFATLCQNGSTDTMTTGHNNNKKNVAARSTSTMAPLGESGVPLTYRGSRVHRIEPGFVLQGGDFVFGNGSGGESIYNGKKFKDERPGLLRKHDRRGVLSMGNAGKNSNSSQWFITFDKAPQCDGKHVIFGHVVSGWDVLDAAERLGPKKHPSSSSSGEPVDDDGRPVVVTVTDCGIYVPFVTPAAGYWFDQPDPEAYGGISPVFRVRPRVGIVAPNPAVAERFIQRLHQRQRHAVVTILLGATQEDCQQALDSISVDVIVHAPTVDLSGLVLSSAWHHTSIDQVVLSAKPLEADLVLAERSWWRQVSNWQLD
jgi:peptidylprolyl isomerase